MKRGLSCYADSIHTTYGTDLCCNAVLRLDSEGRRSHAPLRPPLRARQRGPSSPSESDGGSPVLPGKAVNSDLASGSFASSQTLAILREFGETSLDFEVL